VVDNKADSSSDIPNGKLAAIASRLTTPFELLFGTQLDYQVFFPFGAVGYYQKNLEASSKKQSKFKSQTIAGITIGYSDFTNGMVFWDHICSHCENTQIISERQCSHRRGVKRY
jgi:hypothetical protein